MKQAVRENRQGRVRVAEELLLDQAPEVAILRSRMEVCDQVHDLYTRAVWFVGYAPEFQPLELGERPPEYDAVFMRDSLGVPHLATFSRRPLSADPRITAFIAAGDEWLRRIFQHTPR